MPKTKTAAPAKRKPGRPPKLIADAKTIAQIKELAGLQCTREEAAAVLLVNRDTFADFMKREPVALEAWENGMLNGRVSLRRYQFNLAKTHAGMAIFLGKQLLGQRDQVALNHSGYIADKNLDEVRGAIQGKFARIAAAARA